MNRKTSIIICVTCIAIIIISLLGITFGFYMTKVFGNETAKSVEITTADSKVTFRDLSTTNETYSLGLGESFTKTFTVENTGQGTADYYVALTNVTNNFNRKEDIRYTLYRVGYNKEETALDFPENLSSCKEKVDDTFSTSCTVVIENGEYPSVDSIISQKEVLPTTGNIYKYLLVVTYINQPEISQDDDKGKIIAGKVQISATEDVSSIPTGFVENVGTLAINYARSKDIVFITDKLVEDVDIKDEAIVYPFSVTNTGETHQNITVKLTDIEIDESLKHIDLRWALYNSNTGNAVSRGIFKDVNENNELLLMTDTILDAGESETNKDYILRIWLHNNGTAQTELLNKDFKAKISVSGEEIEYTDLTDSKCFTVENNSIIKYGYLYPPDPWYYINDECPKDIVIPRTITSISENAFNMGMGFGASAYQNYINRIIISDSVNEIEKNIFGDNTPPNHITIPENVELIPGEAGNGQFASIFISDNTIVESYGLCTNSSSLTFTSNFPPSECANANNIVIMEGVTSINEVAFANNTFTSSLEIPSSVEYIKNAAFINATIDEIIIRGKTKLEDFEDYKGLTTEGYLPEGVKLTFRP